MTTNRDSEKSRDRDVFPTASANLHDSLRPADIRTGDRVAAKLKVDSALIECRVWRLSPFGVEIVVTKSEAPEKGARATVELTIDGKTTNFPGVVVEQNNPFVENGDLLLGIRFTVESNDLDTDRKVDRRKESRWICSEEFYPTAVSPTPGRINDYIYFRIQDISAAGLRMKCSLRNKHLLPEMKLELFAQFPGTESAQIDVVIRRIRIEEEAGKDILAIGAEFDNLSNRASQSIGQYLMQFSAAATPGDIREAGFKINSVAAGAEFYFLKSQEDYDEVLELRKLVHARDGNIAPTTSAKDMGDINDTRSRIIVGKIRNKLVATARLRYNESDAPLEHEAHLEWPANFPRRDQIVEISRAATHPDYRKGDLFTALWRYMATYALQKQRPYVLIGSTTPLVNFYKKCGFKETGHTHGEEIWTIQQHLMICNLHEAVMGKQTHPLYWNQLYAPIVEGAIEAGTIKPNELDSIRMGAYSKLKWIAKLRFRKIRKT